MFTRLPNATAINPTALVLGVLVAVVAALLLPDAASAQSTGNVNFAGSLIERFLWTFVNVLFGWMVWFGGMLLNLSINEYVIGFGTMYTGASGLGFTIDRLWVVVRDIFNLTFIFGLVFIGLRMIFDSSNSSTRKMLIYLILAALLVNFSLFITKFVIDFSNIAAAQLATAFQANGGPADVSGRFMNLMGLTSLWQFATGPDVDFDSMRGGAGLGYILGTMILYIIAAFVFLGGALLLMIRFVVLNIYMVLSPLMFIGWVFPSLAGITKEYWHGFLNRAFFAPAYLLMLYFAQSVLTTFAVTQPGGAGLSSIFGKDGTATFSTVVPPFILTSVFLIAALVVAQKMGANGADGVISLGKTMTGKAKQYTKQASGAATFGAVAAAGRTTVGQRASRWSQSQKLNEWAAKDIFLGKAALNLTRKMADSSFDARKVGDLGKNLGIGTGRKGGYTTIAKERAEADAKFAKSLKEGDPNSVAGKEQVAAHITGSEEYQTALAATTAAAEAKDAAATALATKRAEISAEKARREAEIAEADKSAIPAIKATAERKKQELATYLAESNGEIQDLDAAARQASVAADKAEKAQKAIYEELKGQAEAMVKYANQLEYIKTVEQEANWRSKNTSRFLGTVTGTGAGGAAAGLAGAGALAGMAASGGVGVLGYSVLAAGTDIRNQSVEAMRKTYGKDGTNMVKAEKKREEAQLLQEIIKENTEPEVKKEAAE